MTVQNNSNGSNVSSKGTVQQFKLSAITVDLTIQPRADGLDEETVANYTERVLAGDQFPPVVIYHDKKAKKYWLAIGFHRDESHRRAGKQFINAEVRDGTRRDAILAAAASNTIHGLPRKPEDKRRAVEMVLSDSGWSAWSDREIARMCRVGHPLVADVRKSLTGISSSENDDQQTRTYTTKHGTTATMNVSKIGKPPAQEAAPLPFVCTVCGERSDVPIWHCPNPKCGRHNVSGDLPCVDCGQEGQGHATTRADDAELPATLPMPAATPPKPPAPTQHAGGLAKPPTATPVASIPVQAATTLPEASEQRQEPTATPQTANQETTGLPAKFVTDAKGRPVPERLRRVFEKVTRFRAAIQYYGKAMAEVQDLVDDPDGVGAHIRTESVRIETRNAQAHVKFSMPHIVCPECDGTGEASAARKAEKKLCLCKSLGWLHAGDWNHLPGELKAKAESFAGQQDQDAEDDVAA